MLTARSSPSQDYVAEYGKLWHQVVRVRLSRPIPNDRHSTGPISWRYLVVMLPHVRGTRLPTFAPPILSPPARLTVLAPGPSTRSCRRTK